MSAPTRWEWYPADWATWETIPRRAHPPVWECRPLGLVTLRCFPDKEEDVWRLTVTVWGHRVNRPMRPSLLLTECALPIGGEPPLRECEDLYLEWLASVTPDGGG